MFGTRRRNRLLGLTVGNVLIGLSFGWWVHKHNAHHAHPNEMGRDPDIGAAVALASPDAPGNGRRPLASWLARWQAPLFFPLMLLRSGVCTYSGSSGFCGNETAPRRSKPLSSRCTPRCS